jgi:cytochrome c-type biogenesis protein CcmH/NrfF
MIILGTIMTGTLFGYLPLYLLWFWPVVMLLVGLGALVVADREEWMVEVPPSPKKSARSSKTNSGKR